MVRTSTRSLIAALLLGPTLQSSASHAEAILIEYVGSTMWSGIGDASASGEYVYASTPTGLLAFHREGDSAITKINEVQVLPGSWEQVEALFDRAFLISDRNVLALDLSDPANPSPGGMYPLPTGTDGFPAALTSVDVIPRCTCLAIAYLGDNGSGVLHINASNHNAPEVVGSYSIGGFFDTDGMAVGDDFALEFWFAPPDGIGVDFVNIENPRAPVRVGRLISGYPTWDGIVAGDMLGNLAYLVFWSAFTDEYFRIIRIDSTSPPPTVNEISFPSLTGIRIEADRAYVFNSDSGITTMTLADSLNPTSLGSAPPPGSLWDVDGEIFYMGAPDSRLLMVDWSQPTAPVVRDSFAYAQPPAIFVSKRDTLAFLSSDTQGIQVMNVVDPANPERIESISLNGSVGLTAVVQHYLYAVKADSSIDIVDISDISTATVVNNFRPIGHPLDLLLNGTILLISIADSGLQLVSVADPANPTPIDRIALPGYTASVALEGSFGCAVGNNPYLKLLDFTDPQSPQLIGQFNFGSTSRDVMLADSIAYIADQYQGLLIVDARIPAIPSLIIQYPNTAPYSTLSVDGVGDYALVVRRGEIHALNISDPWNTTWEQEVSTPGSVQHILIEAPYIYVADGSGFTVLSASGTTDVQGPGDALPLAFTLSENVPNPFNSGTEIRFSLSRPENVQLVVYNLLGRHVNRLRSGILPAGAHSVTWDGRLENGQDAPSGVYFYRLVAESRSLTRKMLLLR